MAPIRPTTSLVTGVTILVILCLGSTTLAASMTNSTQVSGSRGESDCPWWYWDCDPCASINDGCYIDWDTCCCRGVCPNDIGDEIYYCEGDLPSEICSLLPKRVNKQRNSPT